MRLKVVLLGMGLIPMLICQGTMNRHSNLPSTLSSLTHAIYYHFYLIQRITPAIHIVESHIPYLEHASIIIQEDRFTCAEILTCVQQIQESHSIDNYRQVWVHFQEYRYVMQPDIQREFMLLTLHLIMALYSFDNQIKERELFLQRECFSTVNFIEELLACIDCYTDSITIGSRSRIPSTPHFIPQIEDITYRFYSLERLKTAVELLQTASLEPAQLFFDSPQDSSVQKLLGTSYSIHDPHMYTCVQHICQENNLNSLFIVWNKLISYHYLYNAPTVTIHEFTKIVLILYKNILMHALANFSEKVIMNELKGILTICDNLDTVSADSLYNTLDEATHIYTMVENIRIQYQARYSWLDIAAGAGLGIIIADCLVI